MSETTLESLTRMRDEMADERDMLIKKVKMLSTNGSFRELPEFVASLRDAETSVRCFNMAMDVVK